MRWASTSMAAAADSLTPATWTDFEAGLHTAHDTAHPYIGGTIGEAHFSSHDPFVFPLPSNMDRLWAMGQAGHPDRYAPATAYGAAGGAASLNTEGQPRAGGAGPGPWASGGQPQDPPTIHSSSFFSPPCSYPHPTAPKSVRSV